jgi:hypothetical protein
MQWFHPVFYFNLVTLLEEPRSDNDPLPVKFKEVGTKLFTTFRDDCATIGLIASTATLNKLIELCKREGDIPFRDLKKLWQELRGRLVDEMDGFRFLSLNLREAEEYLNPWDGWDEIFDRFPSTERDVIEARRCLALGRNTATAFHLMRVMETGLRLLGKSLGDSSLDPRKNPSWNRILERSEKELQKERNKRSPEWKTDEDFFSTATATLRAVQHAWRNPTAHVEKHYDEEEAREIYGSVRTFMRHLATKLAEDDEEESEGEEA